MASDAAACELSEGEWFAPRSTVGVQRAPVDGDSCGEGHSRHHSVTGLRQPGHLVSLIYRQRLTLVTTALIYLCRLQMTYSLGGTVVTYTVNRKKHTQNVLSYLLWNPVDSDTICYTLSWINLQYSSLNVFLLTWIMSLHYLVKLSIAFLSEQ